MEDDLRERLASAIGFDWDESNADKNWIKHAVRFTECEEVFARGFLAIPTRNRPGSREERFVVLGRTALGRRLSIAFTFRGYRVRVISARGMNRKENREYSRNEETQIDPEIPR
ncbi:MAG: BrnT family toxin [Acidobacteriota bacterium]